MLVVFIPIATTRYYRFRFGLVCTCLRTSWRLTIRFCPSTKHPSELQGALFIWNAAANMRGVRKTVSSLFLPSLISESGARHFINATHDHHIVVLKARQMFRFTTQSLRSLFLCNHEQKCWNLGKRAFSILRLSAYSVIEVNYKGTLHVLIFHRGLKAVEVKKMNSEERKRGWHHLITFRGYFELRWWLASQFMVKVSALKIAGCD